MKKVISVGHVIWITGLSGAGKSTVAKDLAELLHMRGMHVIRLDGDDVRNAIADKNIGHDRESRVINAYRISRLAKTFAEQGLIVIVATMSLFHEVHEWNRGNLPGYYEVLIDADLETVMGRDPKGLYRKASMGEEINVIGVHMNAELPRSPDFIVANTLDHVSVRPISEKILQNWLQTHV